VEAIRALVVAKRSARSAKVQAFNQIRHLSFAAPEQLRQRLAGVSRQHLAVRAAGLGAARSGLVTVGQPVSRPADDQDRHLWLEL
jgi:hypothetical protein